MNTPFSVIGEEDCFGLVYELCFDKIIEIRLFMLNLLVSRFKNEAFRQFSQHKYHKIVYLTIFSIFEPNPYLNATSTKVIESIVKCTEKDQCCLGLTVLLFSCKLILNDILNGLLREEYRLNIDYFLTNFDRLWLSKK